MAKPNSKEGLKEYALRKLGKPVLEINVDDDQIDDLIDDAIQYFHERHGEGIDRVFLKHKLLQTEKDAFVGTAKTTTVTDNYGGISTLEYEEGANYLPLPDSVIGVNKVFKMDSSSISDGLFNIKYQIFLNDVYYYGAIDLLNYSMVKSYLETLDYLINPDAQVRFNKKNSRLYLDINLKELTNNHYLILDCYRVVDPESETAVYNDHWLKQYTTSLIKRQWGQNLIKFTGVKLPGGLELNGRQIYDDAVLEIEKLEKQLMDEYAMPPLDMVG
tara:strand:+ start:2254 stop:3072 length:819 start_codon:yes stop_codon:yes gene_type:complete